MLCQEDTYGTINSYLQAHGRTGAANSLGISVRSDGTFFTYAPPSNIENSIVTNISQNTNSIGFVKFGNGLIIQWGYVTMTQNQKLVVTFPTPFTTNKFQVVAQSQVQSFGEYLNGHSCWNFTPTSFTIQIAESGGIRDWIAIGF